jgi:hypothetical protein
MYRIFILLFVAISAKQRRFVMAKRVTSKKISTYKYDLPAGDLVEKREISQDLASYFGNEKLTNRQIASATGLSEATVSRKRTQFMQATITSLQKKLAEGVASPATDLVLSHYSHLDDGIPLTPDQIEAKMHELTKLHLQKEKQKAKNALLAGEIKERHLQQALDDELDFTDYSPPALIYLGQLLSDG